MSPHEIFIYWMRRIRSELLFDTSRIIRIFSYRHTKIKLIFVDVSEYNGKIFAIAGNLRYIYLELNIKEHKIKNYNFKYDPVLYIEGRQKVDNGISAEKINKRLFVDSDEYRHKILVQLMSKYHHVKTNYSGMSRETYESAMIDLEQARELKKQQLKNYAKKYLAEKRKQKMQQRKEKTKPY